MSKIELAREIAAQLYGQSLAYVYSRETKDAAHIAKVLTDS
jgi:hypothetical protein